MDFLTKLSSIGRKSPSAPLSNSRLLCFEICVLLAGLLLGQLFLYRAVVFGPKILLPLDILSMPDMYSSKNPSSVFSDPTQFDQIQLIEPARRFAASEIRAGRWPIWSPLQFAGSPYMGFWPVLQWLYVIWPTPRTLPYIQIIASLIAGVGAYCFFRDVLQLGTWSAVVAAWCYPLTGFFVLWQGQSLQHAVVWLPWVLWSTDRSVQNPEKFGGIALAIFTFFSISNGTVDIAGEILLVSGLYMLWRVSELAAADGYSIRSIMKRIRSPAAGWFLGFLLSAGMLLPLIEYAPTGARMRDRAVGNEERPPVGLSALPLLVLPEFRGTTRAGSFLIVDGNMPESASSGYAGLIAALFLAPLAGSRGKRGRQIAFWCVMGFLGTGWVLNVPGLVEFYRLPFFRMFSWNRFVFITGWSVLCLAAMGLDSLWNGIPRLRWWHLVPVIMTVVLGLICFTHAASLPEPLATHFERYLRAGKTLLNMPNLNQLTIIKQWFVASYLTGAVVCAATLIGWGCVLFARVPQRFVFVWGSLTLLVELFRFASAGVVACDPELYYPQIPVLKKLAAAPEGRFLGVNCLPPRVTEHYGLRDIRGYDAVDPAAIVELLDLVRDKKVQSDVYARTQWYSPVFQNTGESKTLKVPGVLNMLNLRYLVFSKSVPKQNALLFSGDGYEVWENPDFLPRAFVPRVVTNDRSERYLLTTMAKPTFNAEEHSYADISKNYEDCRGTVRIIRENPQQIEMDVEMETPGVVILSDLWYRGWKATIDGRHVPIVIANHAIRAVEVPVGRSTLIMSYEPDSLKWGLRIAFTGLIFWSEWAAVVFWKSRRGI